MKNIILTVILFISTAIYASDFVPMDDFSSIAVYDGVVVNIERSDVNEMKVSRTNLKDEDIDISITDGKLSVRVVHTARSGAQLMIHVKYNNLRNIEAYDKAEINTVKVHTGDSINLRFKTGSVGYIDLDVKHANISVSEGSLVVSEGYAINQNISVITNGTFSGYKLEGETATVKANTTAKAKIYITNEVDAKASTKGFIGYRGNPKFKSKKASMGGEVVPWEDDEDDRL